MNIAIIGAGIGLESVNQALEKGHTVVALSTKTDHINDHPNLIKINGSATSTYKVLSELKKGLKVGKVSRADVANFLVDEAENQRFIHQFVTLTN